MKPIKWLLLFLGTVLSYGVNGQTFYLYKKDYCEVQCPMLFLDDSIHQRYVFGYGSICSDSNYVCRLFSTSYSGLILDSFSYSSNFDSSLVLQEVISIDSDGYSLLGFKRPHRWSGYYSGAPVITKYDLHLNQVFEHMIPFTDSLLLHDLSLCRTPHSTYVLSATVGKRYAQSMSFYPPMLYEITSTGDSVRQRIFSSPDQQGMFFSVIPRNDSAGYWVSSSLFLSTYPNGYLSIDTNFNYIHGVPYYYNSSMFCYCGAGPTYLTSFTPSSFIESRLKGVDSVQRHYIIKHSNDAGYICKSSMPSTNDSADIGHFRYFNKPMSVSVSNDLYVLNNTHMVGGLEMHPNFIEVNKLDTNLNFRWTRYIGGDRIYYPFNIYSTHAGVMILGTYNNMTSALGYRGENIYFFSLDSLGTVNSIHSPLSHEESLVDIYPNPSTGHFSCLIEDRLKNSYIHIFNSNGQWVYSKLLKQNEEELNLEKLQSGIYYYSISSEKEKWCGGKLIIK